MNAKLGPGVSVGFGHKGCGFATIANQGVARSRSNLTEDTGCIDL